MALGVVEGAGSGADVGGLAAEDFFGLVEGLAALPEFDDEGVAGLWSWCRGPSRGRRGGCPCRSRRRPAWSVGRAKPPATKLAGLQVELAEGVGVFAAGGEGDQAELSPG